MKKLALLLLLVCPVLRAQSTRSYIVRTLPPPSSKVVGSIVTVTDGINTGDCTIGGGVSLSLCRDSGSAWVSVSGGSGTLAVANGGTGTNTPLTGIVRGGVVSMTAAELSGDATTSGSNAVTVKKLNGVSLAGLASGILYNTTGTGVPSIATQGQILSTCITCVTSSASLTSNRILIGTGSQGAAVDSKLDDGVTTANTLTYTGSNGFAVIMTSNKVFYADQYSGATIDVQINACLTAALAVGGTCDARGLGSPNVPINGHPTPQVYNATIVVGDNSGDPVTLLLPVSGWWSAGMSDGVSCGVKQYSGTNIIGGGPVSALPSQMVFGATSGSSLASLFCVVPSTAQGAGNYTYDFGFQVNNGQYTGLGAVTTNNIGFYIQGSSGNTFNDVTKFDHVVIGDKLDAYAMEITGMCCSATFDGIQINGFQFSTPLNIVATSSVGSDAVNFINSSIVHPGPALPVINISDTGGHNSTFNFTNIYTEGSTTDTTTALYQISGAGAVNFTNINLRAESSSDAAYGISVANVGSTQLTVTGLSMTNGSGSWSGSHGVTNALLGTNVSVDSIGNLSFYYSNATWAFQGPGASGNFAMNVQGTGDLGNFGGSSALDYFQFAGSRAFLGYDGTHAFIQGNQNGIALVPGSNTAAGSGPFGAYILYNVAACEASFGVTTISGGASTTTGVSCLPANAIIDMVSYRVTTTITTAVSFTLGDSGSATRFSTCAFSGGSQSMTAGATGNCNAGYYQNGTTALGVKITPNTTPGAGALRLMAFYHTFIAPTS